MPRADSRLPELFRLSRAGEAAWRPRAGTRPAPTAHTGGARWAGGCQPRFGGLTAAGGHETRPYDNRVGRGGYRAMQTFFGSV